MINVQEWAEIKRLYETEGLSKHAIARKLGRNRRTIDRAIASNSPPTYTRPERPSKIDPYVDKIIELLKLDSTIPSQRIREEITELGYDGGKTICDQRVRELRAIHAPARVFQKTKYTPGEILQIDLWQPKHEIPVGMDQTRKPYIVVCTLAYSRAGAGTLIFSREAPDILAGLWRAITRLGGLPKLLVTDREGALHAGGGRPSDSFVAFAGALSCKAVLLGAGDCQAKGVVERQQGHMATNFQPGRRFTDPAHCQSELDAWFDRANVRLHRSLRERVDERFAREAPQLRKLCAPPETDHRFVTRVSQQPWIRFDTSDYSIDPRAAGRRVEVRVGPERFTAGLLGSGEVVADHERVFAKHQVITDPVHQEMLMLKRRERAAAIPPGRPAAVDVELRDLSRYDELVA